MPSVLVETGFLTNPKEGKVFKFTPKGPKGRWQTPCLLHFRKYKNELEGVEELIEDKPIVQTGS